MRGVVGFGVARERLVMRAGVINDGRFALAPVGEHERPSAAAARAVLAVSESQVGVRCGGRFTNYEDLLDRALRATRGLHELGVGAGDRVALLLRNSIEYLEASIATVPLGASAVPINWHWRGDEIAHVLLDSRAKALVVHADLWSALAANVPDDLTVVLVPAEADDVFAEPDGALRWEDWLGRNTPWAQPPEGAPVSIIYTSGTTGQPKGVARRRNSRPSALAQSTAAAEVQVAFRLPAESAST